MNSDRDVAWEAIIDARREACLAKAVPTEDKWKLQVFDSPISFKEARLLVHKNQPFVVKGLDVAQPVGEASSVFSFLKKEVGQRQVPVESKDGMLLMTMSELINQIDDASSEKKLYLYDVPIAKRLSSLFEWWKLPSYFCVFDVLNKTRLPHSFSNSWPTLFIGSKVVYKRKIDFV